MGFKDWFKPPSEDEIRKKVLDGKTVLVVHPDTGELRCGKCGAADIFRRRPKGT